MRLVIMVLLTRISSYVEKLRLKIEKSLLMEVLEKAVLEIFSGG